MTRKFNDFIKSANRDEIFSHPDVQQRMLMMMGDNKNTKLELDKTEENKIAKNYQKMYLDIFMELYNYVSEERRYK